MRIASILLIALLTLAISNPAQADEKTKDTADVRVWEGYVWKGADGKLRIGWPVVAMGVMAQPQHIIAAPAPERYAPFITPANDMYIFWNYTLEEDFTKSLPRLPKVLIQVKGRVTQEGTDGGVTFGGRGSGTLTMHDPQVLRVEFISDDWLKAWAPVFREPWSPWRIRKRPTGDAKDGTKAVAPKILAAVKAMRASGGATAAQRTLAAKSFPSARIVKTFRTGQEHALVAWLRRVDKEHGLKLEGLAALGPVPPSGQVLQRLFVAAETKAAFFRAVRAKWKGELSELSLHYYESKERGGVSWISIRLDAVEADWTEASFAAHRKLTRATLKR